MAFIGRRQVLIGAASAWLGAHAGTGTAFPTKRMTIVVPFSPGSATDLIARVVGQGVTEQTGQPVVVDNRPGGSGSIGATAVARAPADGYTLLVTTNTTQAGNLHMFKRLPYDPVKDFAPITLLGRGEQIMVVAAASPYRSIGDVVAAARQTPGKLSFGAGSLNPRIAGEMFQQATGTQMLYVPYKGNPEVVTDLLGGRVDTAILDAPTVLPHFRAGTLRALGSSGTNRFALLPDVPTIAESGLPGFDISFWFGAYAPAGTPADIVQRLHDLLVQATKAAPARELYAKSSILPLTSTPTELARFQEREAAKWGEVIRKARIEPE
ncbi:MAG TPA: tripartite tricarboxylate transporter substrate binding protein [Ramlibacter sp.]|nr:tripartite tricarboxylate transporter substrate binding protein [Ramlibacter sp.]